MLIEKGVNCRRSLAAFIVRLGFINGNCSALEKKSDAKPPGGAKVYSGN